MLEINNLTKIYHPKGGAEVRALDDVSVRFAEKGMVFLLGKSGSGKSTLLNLCGGLDAPDGGEIIIKGKSSKAFSQSDFDSYRNTFVGFVFQEYNILDEFSVEENIALALELQGKNKDRKKVAEILEKVDLANFAKRKPNTLSGGQKQRVAIARALVKDPEIIMADEPTGALDSNTGKQVFDTLKKLSQDKLVIVVSHDREFAEIYGDRIIELKDGKVIDDVVKTRIQPQIKSERITQVGEHTIAVRDGAALDEADFAAIRTFLKKSDGEVLIASGEKEIGEFRKAARIDADNARESFRTTDEAEILKRDYRPEDSKFIRSKLPARHAIRIGASGLKVKPVRLMFTIFLAFVAFTMFGLFSTLMFYNKNEVMTETLMQQKAEYLQLKKSYTITSEQYENGELSYSMTYTSPTLFTPEDLKAYQAKYGADTFATFSYAIPSDYGSTNDGFSIEGLGKDSGFVQPSILRFAEIGADSTAFADKLLTATDLSALGKNGIVIPSYLFDRIKQVRLTNASGSPVPLTDYNSIVGKNLTIFNYSGGRAKLVVKGVYRCDLPQKYAEIAASEKGDPTEVSRLIKEVTYGMYMVPLVGPEFYQEHVETFRSYTIDTRGEFASFNNEQDTTFSVVRGAERVAESTQRFYNFAAYSDRSSIFQTAFFDEGKTTLADGEIVVNSDFLIDMIYTAMQSDYESEYDSYSDYRTARDSEKSVAERLAAFRRLKAQFDAAGFQLEKAAFVDQAETPVTIVGLMFCTAGFGADSYVYLSQNDFDRYAAEMRAKEPYYSVESTKYRFEADAVYDRIVMPFPADRATVAEFVKGAGIVNPTDDTSYAIHFSAGDSLEMVNSMVTILEQVFLWVGVTFAVFSMLLMFNFISVSIAQKKKEIGILRAVGARSADVFKIFYAESAIITLICMVLSIVAGFVICSVLNNRIGTDLGASIFVFGPMSVLMIVGISILTSLIATFLPVYNIARKKPVESIRSL